MFFPRFFFSCLFSTFPVFFLLLDSEKFLKEKIAKPGIFWYPYSYHTNKERTPERLSRAV